MSTVATTRGPSVLTPIGAETSTLRPLAAMHPDCLILPQPQSASSPRLSSLSPPAHAAVKDTNGKRAEFVLHATKSSMEIDAATLNIDEDIDEDNERIDATPTSMQQDIDAVSVCSDTSVLSVGQEHATQAPERQLRHPSAFSSVQTSADCSDARSSVSTDEPATTPHCLDDDNSHHLLQQQQQQQQQSHEARHVVMDPFIVANALRIPVPLVPRTNNSPFQEEFLRKSQLYAGEIMKQQMQLMAAARANAFGLRPGERAAPNSPHFAQLTAISKITQLNAVAAAAAAAAAVVANNQKLAPNAAHNNSDALAQLSALSMAQQQQTQALKTVSSLNRLQAQMHAATAAQQMPLHNNYNNYNNNNNSNMIINNNKNNNNFPHDQHEPALKFSIDNILKADFGRRMAAAAAAADQTDRLLKQQQQQQQRRYDATTTFLPASTTTITTTIPTISSNAVMDLSSLMSSAASVASSNFSNSLANICTNSNDSSSTALSSNTNNNNNNSSNNNSDFLKSLNSSVSGDHGSSTGAQHNRLTNAINEAQRKNETPSDLCKNGTNASMTNSISTTTTPTTTTAAAATTTTTSNGTGASGSGPIVWPAWVYCTRYSDRPSSGPRARKPKKATNEKGNASPSSGSSSAEDKRPRTAFSGSQLARLKHEFTENRYLTEKRRQQLSSELGLNEAQIKIWFQNKRAKLKKSSGTKNPLALQLMAQGLYNHSTVPLTREEEELQELQEREREAAAAAT